MRNLVLLSLALLPACAAAPAEPVVHGQVPGHICDAAGTERFVGQPGTSETGAAILRATHSATLRWAPPGYMLTMDFSASRVTVHLGPDYKVTDIKCG
jgi:hypothetical protein